MSGYMVMTYFFGTNQFYMVNSQDPERACEEVLKITGGEVAQALTPLSDETLEFYKVQPKEPWLSFTTLPNGAVLSTAFSDIAEVGRDELRLI